MPSSRQPPTFEKGLGLHFQFTQCKSLEPFSNIDRRICQKTVQTLGLAVQTEHIRVVYSLPELRSGKRVVLACGIGASLPFRLLTVAFLGLGAVAKSLKFDVGWDRMYLRIADLFKFFGSRQGGAGHA